MYIEDKYKITYRGRDLGRIIIGVESREPIQARITQGVSMVHSDVNRYLRGLMYSR